MEHLNTSSAVIDALGGTVEVARLAAEASPVGTCSPQSVSNWRNSGRLPPYTYEFFTEELAARGKVASPRLWGITPRREATSATQ